MSDGLPDESALDRRKSPEMVMGSVERIWAGPLPPPAVLEHYEQTLSGAADRILLMAEKQLEHRQLLEHEAVIANNRAQQRGVWPGFLLSLFVTGGGIAIILTGHSTAGLVAILSTLTALVGTFIYGRRSQRRELDRKRPEAKTKAA